MQLLIEVIPLITFFATYKLYDIFVATAAAIVVSAIQVSVYWIKHHRIERMQLLTLGLIALLGTATLLFKDDTFIKWKPTVFNWGFALVLLASRYIWHRNLIKRLIGHSVVLPQTVWEHLEFLWILFFITVGGANLFVAYQYDTNTWVNFKLFGFIGLTLIFMALQGVYVARVCQVEDR